MPFGIDDVAVAAFSEALKEGASEALKGVSEEIASQEFGEEAFKESLDHNPSEMHGNNYRVKFSSDVREVVEEEFSPTRFMDLGIEKISEFFNSDVSSIAEDHSIQEFERPEETSVITQIKTINSGLEGQCHPITGVEFERKVVTTELGEKIEGVFPQFESVFNAQLPEDLRLASDADQFRECNRQLKERFDSDPEFRKQFDERQKENIQDGITPYGYTWHHSEEVGKMQLIDYDSHQKTAHTGGRFIWGGGTEFR